MSYVTFIFYTGGDMPSRYLPRRAAALRDAEDEAGGDDGRHGGVGRGADLPHQSLQHTTDGQDLLWCLRDL